MGAKCSVKDDSATFEIEYAEGKTKTYDAIDLAAKFQNFNDDVSLEEQVKQLKAYFDLPDMSSSQALVAANAFMEYMEGLKKKWPWMQSFGASTESEESPKPEENAKNAETV